RRPRLAALRVAMPGAKPGGDLRDGLPCDEAAGSSAPGSVVHGECRRPARDSARWLITQRPRVQILQVPTPLAPVHAHDQLPEQRAEPLMDARGPMP